MNPDVITPFKQALKESLDALKSRLSGVRTSRASPALLEPLVVEAYGGRMPLSQLATVSTPEARTLLVQVWDNTVVPQVQKALAQFGMNPSTEGASLRVHLPELTQERRKEYVKMAKDHGEHSRIGIRNVRRECLDGVTKDLFSEDQMHSLKKEVQKMTDDAMAEVDRLMEAKEKEIMSVV